MRWKSVFSQPELQVFLFCLFAALLNWPFVSISYIASPGGLFVYFFVLWAAAIGGLFLIARSLQEQAGSEDTEER